MFLLHLFCRLTNTVYISKTFRTAPVRHFIHYESYIVLNDGVYGTLAEWRDMKFPSRMWMQLFDPTGQRRTGTKTDFGPIWANMRRSRQIADFYQLTLGSAGWCLF